MQVLIALLFVGKYCLIQGWYSDTPDIMITLNLAYLKSMSDIGFYFALEMRNRPQLF